MDNETRVAEFALACRTGFRRKAIIEIMGRGAQLHKAMSLVRTIAQLPEEDRKAFLEWSKTAT